MNKRGTKRTTRPARAKTTAKASESPKRIPVAFQNTMKYEQREGYTRRVVNDVNDGQRVRMMELGGWKIVGQGDQDLSDATMTPSQIGTQVRRSVGGGVTGVLMEIPTPIYEKDQRAKQAIIDAREANMRRKNTREPDKDGTYGEVTIGRKLY
ncbi:MAG: hypothetical protein ABIG30_00810 [Candidatus Aenigmatarchaeota archaeon]